MNGQPRGSRGVTLYSNGTWKYSQAEIFGVDFLSRLSFNYVWGSSKYHKFLGKLGAIPDKVGIKCAFKVQIERSAEFLQWI